MGRPAQLLPCKGRGQRAALTEGYFPLDSAIPLHHRFTMVPLPLQGRID